MIKIKREEHNFIRVWDIEFVVSGLTPHSYRLYVDLSNGEICISKRTVKNPKYKHLGSVKAIKESTCKKFTNTLTKSIHQIIQKYTRNGCFVCRTTANKTYGKEFVGEQDFYAETDNPYYKCAGPMYLYNKDVLDYNYQTYKMKAS